MIPKEERLILSDFYRKEVIRLRDEIQDLLEGSYTIESIFKKLVEKDFYFNAEDKLSHGLEKNYFYIYLCDENGKIIYPPKKEIDTKDLVNFEINIPQFKGDCVFISKNIFNKEEVVCLMSLFSKFKDVLNVVSKREIKRIIPETLNEAISRGSLETKDQLSILNEMLKEVIDKSDNSPNFLYSFNLIFQNVINTVERIGVMAQSYLGLLDEYKSRKTEKKPVNIRSAVEESLQMLPNDIDKSKFYINIEKSIIVNIDEDKFRYAISNILSYGNRKSDQIIVNSENLLPEKEIVISFILSGVRIDEKDILTIDENKLRNTIELSSAIEYITEIFKGRFWINNSQSKGTTLSITIPKE